MEPAFLALVDAFETEVDWAVSTFERLSGQDPRLWLRRQVKQVWRFDEDPPVEVFFHGIGMRLRQGTREIDFDWTFDGRRGVTAWWLSQFAMGRPGFARYASRDACEAALKRAALAGELQQDTDSGLWMRSRGPRTS